MPEIRISDPYKHRGRYRCRLSAGQGRTAWAPAGNTMEEARERADRAAAAYQETIGVTCGELIDRFVEHLKINDRAPPTLVDARNKLLLLLEPLLGDEVVSVSLSRAKACYLGLAPTCAAATHHEALSRGRGAWAWAVKQGFVRSNPWLEVEKVGRANAGKPKLTIDETNKLIEACLVDVDSADGALAILVVIFCGVRSSEILKRQVRDIDAGGTRLNIVTAKTKAGVRAPKIPEVIQAAVQRRVVGRPTDAQLIVSSSGKRPTATWLEQCLKWYCGRAGVPVVCPHALRGGWADIAYSSGEAPDRVAAFLGHASAATTLKHYVGAGVADDAKQARRLRGLQGGKK